MWPLSSNTSHRGVVEHNALQNCHGFGTSIPIRLGGGRSALVAASLHAWGIVTWALLRLGNRVAAWGDENDRREEGGKGEGLHRGYLQQNRGGSLALEGQEREGACSKAVARAAPRVGRGQRTTVATEYAPTQESRDRWGCIRFIRKEVTAYIKHHVKSSHRSNPEVYQTIS